MDDPAHLGDGDDGRTLGVEVHWRHAAPVGIVQRGVDGDDNDFGLGECSSDPRLVFVIGNLVGDNPHLTLTPF